MALSYQYTIQPRPIRTQRLIVPHELRKPSTERAQCTGKALEEVLVSAKDNDFSPSASTSACQSYESVACPSCPVMDEEFECDIALQIHFTLIQSFCFDNDISIVRVSDMQRLAEIVGDKAEQLEDAHCILITVRRAQ
ncbi:growth arrest and DNA damage-inducible protein GADD45 gamma-like protein [Lates japonicus]|uniref:Growth arrest and DNA damage-inducible protein GADD45 gamma-like protein n=1 Tax=Lates japonicus TaxID=270547 RepID=A0AAD3MN44_LATJO|nr:growth arrest and DNA damage-inducible protein GADD45 gamma-like protein [Lates japonicus]